MSNKIKYLSLILIGLLLIVICSKFHGPRKVETIHEYYFSSYLMSNYSLLTAILFFIAGLAIGYYWKLSPWLSGIFLIAIFPLTSIVESLIYRGSHNLIPIEFAFHFYFALPAIGGVYLGKLILWIKANNILKKRSLPKP